MNQDKAKPKPRPETRTPQPDPPPTAANAPAQVPPAPSSPTAPPPAPKIEVNPALLSQSLARDLQRIPPAEWFRIESIPWRVEFTRDMAEGIRFVDAVANVVNQKGGLFDTRNLGMRRQLEQSSEEILEAFRAFIRTTVKVARKMGLTNILQRHWRLLAAYGSPPKKADDAKAGPEPAAEKKAGPSEAA